MPEARLHDESTIAVEVHGRGPTVLPPVNPRPVEGPRAEELRRWGADPALGRALIDGLGDAFRVVAFDYEGHVFQVPKPDTMTPANVADDLLAVADAAGADRFAYYGYSWLAHAGLQLAIRNDRLATLVMGGFPPLDAPYSQMLQVTTATHAMAMTSGVHVSLAGPIISRRAELEALGWQVRVLDGLDHTQAMQAVHVLPILRPWLAHAGHTQRRMT